MAMIYTLVTSAKEWLSEQFRQNNNDDAGAAEAQKDEVRFCVNPLVKHCSGGYTFFRFPSVNRVIL